MNNRTEKIIQFGEGGFLRGFADWILQNVDDKTDFNASAVIVQPIKEGMCDTLTSQGCVYTHICRGVEGIDRRKIDVISRCINPYTDFGAYIKLAENKDFRFIISNTTEAGITYNEDDKPTDTPPVSFPAKVTILLKRRYDIGLGGFVFLPCELIDKNGAKLKEIILRYSKEWNFGDDFIRWIEEENIFCNTLVDRIVPGYPRDEKIDLGYEDKMLNTSEFFHLWAIEGYMDLFKEYPMDKPENLNVVLTGNLSHYRNLKVRILNGAHTSLVHYALLEGFDTVKSCIDNEKMLSYIKNCVFDEIIPSLDIDKDEAIEYANNVLKRFSNPYIRHYLTSITLNSVSKFKVRVLPSIIEYKNRFGKLPANLVFSLAKLIEYYKTCIPNDDEGVIAFIKKASIEEILKNTDLWGEDISFMLKEVEKYADK